MAHGSEDFGLSGTHLRLGGVPGGGSLWQDRSPRPQKLQRPAKTPPPKHPSAPPKCCQNLKAK